MQARVGAIAQLYDLISQSSLGRTIPVDTYLKEIAKTMSASLLGNASSITIEVKAEPLEIDVAGHPDLEQLVAEVAEGRDCALVRGGARVAVVTASTRTAGGSGRQDGARRPKK